MGKGDQLYGDGWKLNFDEEHIIVHKVEEI